MLYVDDVIIISKDLEWLQGSLNVLIGLFRRVRLMTNVANSSTMICQTELIHTGMSEEYFNWRSTGYGYSYQEILRNHIPCPDCRLELTDGSMMTE